MRSPAAAGADFSDVLPSPTSPAASPSHPSPGRHYYLAVDRIQFKMRTLLELLGVVAERRVGLPIAICVSSRDELDAVCAAVANLPFVSLSPLYSDQAEAERASVLDKFRQATAQWNHATKATNITESSKPESTCSKLSIIVATDACLPLSAMAEAPLMARVLMNYELPAKKEAYLRRMSACLAADGIVINMVVGGEVATLKALEESSGLLIAEMPIHENSALKQYPKSLKEYIMCKNEVSAAFNASIIWFDNEKKHIARQKVRKREHVYTLKIANVPNLTCKILEA